MRCIWLFLLALLASPLSAQTLHPALHPATGLWGYRDSLGQWAIAAGYWAVSPFVDGHALVTVDEEKFIRPDGSVFPPLYRVKGSRSWRPQHLIDRQGRIRCSLPVGYQADPWALPAEGLLPVRNPAGLYGYVDTLGNLVLPFRFAQAWSFGEGRAAVQVRPEDVDSLYYRLPQALQDPFDRALREWRSDQPELIREGFPHGGISTVFIDPQGEVQAFLPARYYAVEDGAFRFSQGLLPCRDLLEEKEGMLGEGFAVALPFQYDRIGLPQANRAFAVRTPTYRGLAPPGETVVGFIDLAGMPVFDISESFLADAECSYWVQGYPMNARGGWLVLNPADCAERRFLRVSEQGELVEYFTHPAR